MDREGVWGRMNGWLDEEGCVGREAGRDEWMEGVQG